MGTHSDWRRYYDADNIDYEISDNEEAEKDEEQARHSAVRSAKHAAGCPTCDATCNLRRVTHTVQHCMQHAARITEEESEPAWREGWGCRQGLHGLSQYCSTHV